MAARVHARPRRRNALTMAARRRCLLSCAVMACLFAATPLPASAQRPRPDTSSPAGPVPRRADGKPDLTGRWDGGGGALFNTVILEEHAGGFGITAGHSLIIDPKDGIIPYQPW